ncbi:hypothetical protein ABID21_001889 [Pseudorhizobium tarimense]|uniref:Uncharacterized protein n=1 Tax=Pseudorhizobium tarimense TaxID=1079109 RepID=A0ABV2H5F4_9HYPH|nr:hypothetical protein [Pseudorhizobium tarimense]MCJ8518985.1 hypothetical protein [Pseudorhizobium tarimense]
MSNFRVGQKVVCVKNMTTDIGLPYPEVGTVHTVRDVILCPYSKRYGLRLEGWHLGIHPDGVEFILMCEAFRPVVERKTDISCFKAMLNPSKQTVEA